MGFGKGYGHWVFGNGGPFRHDMESWGGHGRHGRHGEGRRRLFDGEELKLLLLALIAEQPRHGYDVIREIKERTGDAYAPSPGVVYPTLTMLDEMGQIEEVKEDGARRRFAITEAGRAELESRRSVAEALMARLTEIGEARQKSDHAPIRRAMTNLHMALRQTVHEDGERAHAIAEILDDATRRIERL
jgi:DNA-binding PadR family transcriptional regulator